MQIFITIKACRAISKSRFVCLWYCTCSLHSNRYQTKVLKEVFYHRIFSLENFLQLHNVLNFLLWAYKLLERLIQYHLAHLLKEFIRVVS